MNENTKRRQDDTIDLLEMLKYIFKYRKLILITTALGLIIGIVLSIASFMRGEMSKKYTIKTSIAVTSQTEDGLFTTNTLNPNSTDIHLAEDMVDSVIFVIRSDRTLEAAVDQLQLVGITSKDIYDNLSLSQYNKTQIIDISLYWRNAEEGIKILEAINEVCPTILRDILKIGDVRVVNDPKAKYLIGGSVKASTWILMSMMGMMAGMGIAVLMMFFRPTLLNPEDVQNKLGIKLLGEIPKEKHYIDSKGALQAGETSEMNSEVSDHYRSTAHILKKTLENQSGHIFFVTSTDSMEGKTGVAANLGKHFSELEKKVLLIDMDLKTPNLGGKFLQKTDYEHSLNAVYQGETTLDEAILPVNGFLHILPLIHEKDEMFLNNSMLQLIREKAKEYDYVIIDTTAIGETSSILRLNLIADGAVFVIRQDHSTMAKIQQTLTLLKKAEIPILGCVVNQCSKLR